MKNCIKALLTIILLTAFPVFSWGGVPGVIFTSPNNGALSIATNTSIDVTFSEAIDASTINGSTFYLEPATDMTYSFPGSQVIARPKNGLIKYMPYVVHLTTAIKSKSTGEALKSDYTWSFTTGTLIATTSPASNMGGVPVTTSLKVQFNEAMDASTLTSADAGFTLFDNTSKTNVAGSVAYSPADKTATFKPSSSLQLGRTYTAAIGTGIKTVNGEGYAKPYTWNFTTSPDTTPQLAVISTNPDRDETSVPTSTKVSILFNQSMDVSTINGSSVSLSDGSSGVAGTVEYDATSMTIVFSPDVPLNTGTTYSASVSTTVKGLTGRSLSTPYTWNFTTALLSLKLSTLDDKAVTTNEVLNIAGRVSDDVTLVVAGDTITLNPDGTFSTALVLAPGTNPITVTATNTGGGTASETRNITYDKTYPSLIVASPPDNSATSRSFIDVTGTADATANVIVKDNAGNAYSASRNGTSFSATVNLDWALNTVMILASDTAGKTTSAKRTITYNSSAPGLSIGTPPEDMKTSDTSVTIKGTVAGAASSPTLTLSIDGDQVDPPPALSSGEFQHTITFTKEKTYAITATVTDQQGNSATAQRNIIYAKYDLGDAQKALKVAAGLTAPTPELLARYDVAPFRNGQPVPDGKIDIVDVVVILKRIVGLLAW